MGSRWAAGASIAAAAALLALTAPAQAAAPPDRVPGTVQRTARAAPARIDPGTVLVRFAHSNTARAVRLRPGASVARALAAYRARPDVVYAEPDAIVHAAGLGPPDDTLRAGQWGLTQIHAEAGWSLFPGSYAPAAPTPEVAVLDTGIDPAGADLATAVDPAHGASCVNILNACTPAAARDNDPLGHGTHVAGIVAAAADNGAGIAGLAFASPAMSVKVLHGDGTGTVASVAGGIRWAVANGARVLNLSLATTAFSATLCDAVADAVEHGAVVVAAAGNAAGGFGTATPNYPAACPGAVGVAMTDRDDGSPAISNIGFPNVFVSAPGVGIVSTVRDGGYGTLTGTSASTALVSGLAALVLGQHPERTVADVRRVLARTSAKVGGVAYGKDPFGTCASCTWHPWFGYGRIDALQALTGPPPIVTTLTPASAPVGAPVTVDGVDFTAATGVSFGGVTSPFAVVSSSRLTTTVPPGAVAGKVTVTTPGGSGSSPAAFGPAPTFAPAHGRSGSLVALGGPALGSATAVAVNGAAVGFSASSATRLVARIGDAASTGPLTVTTPAGTYTSLDSFVVDPTLGGFSPASGPAGTVVTVAGKGLAGTTAATVGGAAATFAVVPPDALAVTVPPDAVTGPIVVSTRGGGTGATAASFTVTAPNEAWAFFDAAARQSSPIRGGSGTTAGGAQPLPGRDPPWYELGWTPSMGEP